MPISVQRRMLFKQGAWKLFFPLLALTGILCNLEWLDQEAYPPDIRHLAGAACLCAWYLLWRRHAIKQQRAARVAEAFSSLAEAHSAHEDPISVLQLLIRKAIELMEPQDVRVLLAAGRHFPDGLVVEASDASPLHRDAKNKPLADLLASVVDAGKTLPCPYASAGAWRAFPIPTLSGPVGILTVIPKTGAASLSEADCAFLSRLSRQAGLLIENYNLYNDLIRKAAEVTGLAAVAGATLEAQDLPALLALVADQAAVLTGAEDAVILLEESASACWKIAAGRGTLAAALRDHQAPLDAGIPAQVCRDGKPVFANRIESLADVLPCGNDAPLRAALFVPLRKGERVIGSLACLRQTGGRRFTEHDARALEILADQAVIAINNARLYQNALTHEHFQQGVLSLISELRSATDPETLLRECCARVAGLLHVPAVCICRPSGDAPQILAQYPQAAPAAPQCGCSIKACPAAQAQPAIRDFSRTARGGAEECPVLRHIGARAFYCTSLLPQHEAGAVLLFAATESEAWFDGEWQRLAQLLCSHLNSNLETAVAFSAQQQEVEISNALLAVAHLVTTEPDIERVLGTVHDAAVNVLGQGTRIFFLWNSALCPNPPADGEGKRWQRLSESDSRLAEALRKRRESLLIADLAESDLITPALAAHFARGPLLICPLVTRQEELMGAMVVGHQEEGRSFSPRDVAIALGIARLTALATENARLLQHMMDTERMKALGEMVGGVAHDINNLLAGILGNAQLGQLKKDPEGMLAALRNIADACVDGADMLRRIQSINCNKTTAELLDLSVLAHDAIQLTRPCWQDKPRLQLQVTSDLEPQVAVYGKATELREVIVNLLMNAMDAMPQGGAVNVRCRASNQWAILEVSDTGQGMTEDVRRRLFDPFFTTKASRGHGLGLTLAYQIVQQHEGSITVESAPEQGTTFAIRLPLAEGKATQAPIPPLPSSRILVVDDDEMVADALVGILRHAGHAAECAHCATEALQRWRKEAYDLVIADFSMPDLSGVEMAQRIKESAPQTPILLITGWDFQLGEDPEVRAVTDAVLQKPVGHDELLSTLARIACQNAKAKPATATRILVVEDDPAVARVVQEMLTDAGYAVECNNTAEKALECFTREKPQLLITDLHLDGMTGAALACNVKKQSADIPVILLTGWQSAEEDLHAVDYVLEKPFNVADLLELVTLAVGPRAPGKG